MRQIANPEKLSAGSKSSPDRRIDPRSKQNLYQHSQKIRVLHRPYAMLFVDLGERQSQLLRARLRPKEAMRAGLRKSKEPNEPIPSQHGSRAPGRKLLCQHLVHRFVGSVQCVIQRGRIFAAGLRQIRTPTALAADFLGNGSNYLPCLHPAGKVFGNAHDE